jgi:hypothetical protein
MKSALFGTGLLALVLPLELNAATTKEHGAGVIYSHRDQAGNGQNRRHETDDGVSWGSVHWQYLEDVSKITAHAAHDQEVALD